MLETEMILFLIYIGLCLSQDGRELINTGLFYGIFLLPIAFGIIPTIRLIIGCTRRKS